MSVSIKYLHQAMKMFFLYDTNGYLRVCGNTAESKLRYGRIKGHSMNPMLHDGQSVIVDSDVVKLRAGQCYVFINGCKLVLHRLVWNNKHHAIFMGDNTGVVEKVFRANIIAKLIVTKEPFFLRNMITLTNIFFVFISKIPIGSCCFLAARRLTIRMLLRGVSFDEKRIYQA